ncbi:type II toxin-antitoxin system HicA family toxin [Clostridium saccharoperbutylacetonicum]|uniref:type II toxin-antitoxin system HicA family toxin n=1 Tax=Clostridium saccharoperbutylacetonicum TaxID=36745 RepID=UPI0039EA6B7F
MKPKELLKILQKEGWEIKNQKGSHIHLINREKGGKVTVPNHNKDLKTGTLKNIFKQAGL